MSILGSVVSSVTKAVTDPGALVKDAINTVLPKNLSVVGDVAGAVVDFETGRSVQALQHGMEALKDLPQALQGLTGGATSASAAARAGSAAFQPSPPPALGGQSALLNNLLGGGKLQQSLQSLITALVNALQGHAASPTSAGTPSTAPAPTCGSTAGSQTPATSGAATGTPAPSTGGTSATTRPSSSGGAAPKNLSDLLGLSDANFMKAMTSGSLPADVKNDPQAMLQIQARMNQISQMTELLSTMMKAMHDMQMAVIQNVRV